MADVAAMRTLLGRLGFTQAGAAAIVNNEGQGLSMIADLQLMSEEDVGTLCAVVRHPGGMMDDGNGGQMPNRGQNISVMSEKKLKMAVYFVKHKKRCSEAVTHADVTLVNFNVMKALYDIEKAHKDPEAVSDPKDIFDKRDWNKSFETLDKH